MVNTPATQAGAPLAMPLCSFIYSSRPAPSQRPASDSTLDHVQRVGVGVGGRFQQGGVITAGYWAVQQGGAVLAAVSSVGRWIGMGPRCPLRVLPRVR